MCKTCIATFSAPFSFSLKWIKLGYQAMFHVLHIFLFSCILNILYALGSSSGMPNLWRFCRDSTQVSLQFFAALSICRTTQSAPYNQMIFSTTVRIKLIALK